ncbi:MAG: hypothetical protein JWM31_2476 [Solirubrobacterales bacterium]|nr:hypothetical protein [Solirubrobacterales bacterium]
MKAARVKGLKPEAPLADSLERIVTVRLAELCAFMPAAEDPANVTELHDMRIAAKRLRYILEISCDLFGPYAAPAALRTKALQSILGEIHDCDVTLPLVLELADETRAADVAALIAAANAAGATDLDPAGVAATAPHAGAHRGLASMAVYLRARRELLFARFLELWLELEREGFRARLGFAIGERATAALSHELHVEPGAAALPSSEV